jgi:hypothetical protein
MNTEQARKIWAALRDAIREIHNQNASSLSFEELYRSVNFKSLSPVCSALSYVDAFA